VTDLQDNWYESYATEGQPNSVFPRVTMIWTSKINDIHNTISDKFRPQLGHLQTLTLTLRKNT